MVSTSYVDFTAGLNSIPDRTDNTGTGINDLSGREEPLPNRVFDRGGTLTPANAFVPSKGTGDFDVDLGSGTADQDLYVVESDVTGQAPFIIRLEDTTATVTLDAADADDRWDQVFLVVRDATEDGNSDGQTLARLSYRKGDSGTSPSKPGADSEWVHYELLASILVPGGATSISDSDITDERVDSSLLQKLFDESVRRTAASVFGEVLDSEYAARPHGSGDHDSSVSDNPHGSGDHDSSVSDNPHGSGDHDSSVSDNPHGSGDHDSSVSDNPHGNGDHSEEYVPASSNDNLSDITQHSASSTSANDTATILDMTGSGHLLGGIVFGYILDDVTLTVDGTSSSIAVSRGADNAGDDLYVCHLPPVQFDSSLKITFTTGSSVSRVAGQAWTN